MNLKISNIYKNFGDLTAVNNASLTIEKGEIFTILGGSGSGKSTLLRMIAGFEIPTSGSIQIGDRVVTGENSFIPPEKRNVGLVFQDLALFPHMKVSKNIEYALPKGSDSSQVDELLELCNLTKLAKRYPGEISGGEMQRVALARAIASNPDILLLDEPFNNLDVLLKESLLKDIKRIIKSRGITAVFVTHHKDEAYYLSDRLAIMREGKIMQWGTPDEVYSNPNSPYTASFLGKVNSLGDDKFWVRPEDVKLVECGTEVKVSDYTFQGHYYILTGTIETGSFQGDSLTLFSPVKHSPGKIIHIEFSPKNYH